jgi:hypothetical protein
VVLGAGVWAGVGSGGAGGLGAIGGVVVDGATGATELGVAAVGRRSVQPGSIQWGSVNSAPPGWLAETVAVVRYVADKPSYIRALLRPEKEWKPGEPKRKNIQALIDYMDKHYSMQFKPVYAELSELCHFGSTAVWQSHVIVSDEERKAVSRSRPAWRSRRTLYVACAQALELGGAMAESLVALAATVKGEPTSGKIAGALYEVSQEEADASRRLGRRPVRPRAHAGEPGPGSSWS